MNPDAASWAGPTARLEELLAGLPDGAGILVDAGPARVRPYRIRVSPLRRLVLGGRFRDVSPWVRLTRAEDHVRATCVRMADGDDGFPMSPEEMAGVLALGWHEPGPLDGGDFVRFWPDDVPNGPYLPPADRRAAAEGALTLLREVFGAQPDEIRFFDETT